MGGPLHEKTDEDSLPTGGECKTTAMTCQVSIISPCEGLFFAALHEGRRGRSHLSPPAKLTPRAAWRSQQSTRLPMRGRSRRFSFTANPCFKLSQEPGGYPVGNRLDPFGTDSLWSPPRCAFGRLPVEIGSHGIPTGLFLDTARPLS